MSGTAEIALTGKCRYCKAVFDIDPRHPNKEFCKDGHRKLFWRYGQHSVTKVADRMQRQNQKLIASEVKTLRLEFLGRIEGLEQIAGTPAELLGKIAAVDVAQTERADILRGMVDALTLLLRSVELRVRALEARGGGAEAAA